MPAGRRGACEGALSTPTSRDLNQSTSVYDPVHLIGARESLLQGSEFENASQDAQAKG